MPRGRPRRHAHDDVVRRAAAVFQRRGYAATSVADLVEATGVGRGSLYADFGGKAGLFDAALAGYLAGLSVFDPLLAGEPLGGHNLIAYFEALAAADFPGGCFAINTIRERDVVPAASFARVEAAVAGFESAVRRNLEADRIRGALAAGADVEGLVGIVTALDIGLMTYRIVRDEGARHRRVIGELERILR